MKQELHLLRHIINNYKFQLMAKYSKASQETVKEDMERMKKGTLKSSSGQKVTNPKQAIAIALSEARAKGEKAPKPPAKKKAAKK
jgi:hypothetical protein